MGSLNTLRQLVRDLRSQRLRTFLTTFGIVWGTIAVSLLLAFGEGLHHQMIKNAAGLGNGVIIAWPSNTSIPFEGLGRGRSEVRLDESDMLLLKQRSREIGSAQQRVQGMADSAAGSEAALGRRLGGSSFLRRDA